MTVKKSSIISLSNCLPLPTDALKLGLKKNCNLKVGVNENNCIRPAEHV